MLLLVIMPICVIYFRYEVHTGSGLDAHTGIHPCTKAKQDSKVMWNKEKGLLTMYPQYYDIKRYLGV